MKKKKLGNFFNLFDTLESKDALFFTTLTLNELLFVKRYLVVARREPALIDF